MNFNINVLSTTIETKPTAKGSYQVVEVAFKNLGSGKVESKKIMSFTDKAVFSAVSSAKAGDVFTITSEKNEKTGYWDWTNVQQAAPGATTPSPSAPAGKAPVQVKSTYETPEERAKKQVFIIKQSSLNNAIASLT